MDDTGFVPLIVIPNHADLHVVQTCLALGVHDLMNEWQLDAASTPTRTVSFMTDMITRISLMAADLQAVAGCTATECNLKEGI